MMYEQSQISHHDMLTNHVLFLSAIIIDHLQQQFKGDQNVGIAFVYCEYKQRERQTPSNLVAGIWRQLCQQRSAISKAVQNKYQSHYREKIALSFGDIESIAVEVAESYTRVFLVIDAIDECTDEGLNQTVLLQFLQTLKQGGSAIADKVQILVTSRQAEALLETDDKLEILANEDDLRSLVRKRVEFGMSKSKRLADQIRQDNELARKLSENIVERAQRM